MPRWLGLLALVLAVVSIAALTLAWDTQRRVRSFEQELVKRQQDSQSQSSEARMLARQSQDASREAAAKVALLEARLSEVALQRSQVEELMQDAIGKGARVATGGQRAALPGMRHHRERREDRGQVDVGVVEHGGLVCFACK